MELGSMEKEFVPYELSLKLKYLGFNEECFAYYTVDGELNFDDTLFNKNLEHSTLNSQSDWTHLAPLWQQVFDWFYEEFGLFNHIEPLFNIEINGLITDNWCVVIRGNYKSHIGLEKIHAQGRYNAKLKCLEKLIELCEKKIT